MPRADLELSHQFVQVHALLINEACSHSNRGQVRLQICTGPSASTLRQAALHSSGRSWALIKLIGRGRGTVWIFLPMGPDLGKAHGNGNAHQTVFKANVLKLLAGAARSLDTSPQGLQHPGCLIASLASRRASAPAHLFTELASSAHLVLPDLVCRSL